MQQAIQGRPPATEPPFGTAENRFSRACDVRTSRPDSKRQAKNQTRARRVKTSRPAWNSRTKEFRFAAPLDADEGAVAFQGPSPKITDFSGRPKGGVHGA